MRSTRTIFRWLVPALLLTNLALTSCGCKKDQDPKPRKCGTTTDGSTKPGGNS